MVRGGGGPGSSSAPAGPAEAPSCIVPVAVVAANAGTRAHASGQPQACRGSTCNFLIGRAAKTGAADWRRRTGLQTHDCMESARPGQACGRVHGRVRSQVGPLAAVAARGRGRGQRRRQRGLGEAFALRCSEEDELGRLFCVARVRQGRLYAGTADPFVSPWHELAGRPTSEPASPPVSPPIPASRPVGQSASQSPTLTHSA